MSQVKKKKKVQLVKTILDCDVELQGMKGGQNESHGRQLQHSAVTQGSKE